MAIAIALKIFPAFLLLYFILKKHYKIAAWSIAYFFGLILLTVLFVDGSMVINYFLRIVPRLASNEIIGPYYLTNQSFYSLLLCLFSHDALSNPLPLANSPWIVPLLEGLILTFFIVILLRAPQANTLLLFGLTAFTQALTGRYNTSYSLILLLPFLTGLLSVTHRKGEIAVISSILGIALFIPAGSLAGQPLVIQYLRLFLLTLIFVYVAWRHNFGPSFKNFAILAILVGGFKYTTFGIKDKTYFHVQNKKGILYDYVLRGDSIVLHSTLGNKTITEVFALNGAAHFDSVLKVNNNSLIFHNEVLKSPGGNIRKPFIFNDSIAGFMSDKDQGAGFYRLMTVPLK